MKIKAYAANKQKAELKPFSYDVDKLSPWDVGIEITHCGICHSDLHLIDNDWDISNYPLVPGHEIIGIIKEIGKNITHVHKGDRVGIGWQCASCMDCNWCLTGEEQLCNEVKGTCVDQFGGYADYIRTDGRFAFCIPEALPSEFAAPLLCGGATVYTPLIRHEVGPGTKVGVAGIGGLGHLALQFASAMGAEVTALSHSPSKEKEAKELGAHHFLMGKNKKALEAAADSFDFLLSSSTHGVDWDLYLSLLRPKGKLCLLGALEQDFQTSIMNLVGQSKMVCGSNIGSRPGIKQMLEFAALHQIRPKIEVFPMKNVNEAIEKLRANKVRYRAVLKSH